MAQMKDGNGNYGGVVGGMSDAEVEHLESATPSAETAENTVVDAAPAVSPPLTDNCMDPIGSFSATNCETIPPVVAEVSEGGSSYSSANVRDSVMRLLGGLQKNSHLVAQVDEFAASLEVDDVKAFAEFVEKEYQLALKDLPTFVQNDSNSLREKWLATEGAELMQKFNSGARS